VVVYLNMSVTQRNISGYGLPPIDWERVRKAMSTTYTQAPGTGGPDRHTSWLTTTNPDGTSHVRPVGTEQVDGVWYFTSGPATRKSRNVAANPRCVLSIATHPFDLVVEGSAERVTDAGELSAAVDAFNRDGWPAKVEGDAVTADYSAPSAGPPPWYVYRIEPETVYAFGTEEPGGATKYEMGQRD
jgi:Pyridoxamine 5'-phosphate oxidase